MNSWQLSLLGTGHPQIAPSKPFSQPVLERGGSRPVQALPCGTVGAFISPCAWYRVSRARR